jgi:hypothetical protein
MVLAYMHTYALCTDECVVGNGLVYIAIVPLGIYACPIKAFNEKSVVVSGCSMTPYGKISRVTRALNTSSVYATCTVLYEYLSTRDMAESEVYTADHRPTPDERPYEDDSQAYTASKVKALNESER